MRKCKNEECLRELDENEIEYCISCKSENDSKSKKIVKIVGAVAIISLGIVKFIKKFKK
ncbi:MAG: hypothetical protein U5K55_01030 [Aliarcobacter sp.]|nr:hypothetical protein [Aliarcobacter sp.]